MKSERGKANDEREKREKMRWVECARVYLRVENGKLRIGGFLWLCAFLFHSLFFFFLSNIFNIITLRFSFLFPLFLSLAHSSSPKYICCVYTTTSTEKKNFPHRRFCWCFSLSLSLLFLFPFCYCCSTSLCFCDSFFFGANHSPIFILSLIRVRTTTTKSSLVHCCCCCRVSFIFLCAGENYSTNLTANCWR